MAGTFPSAVDPSGGTSVARRTRAQSTLLIALLIGLGLAPAIDASRPEDPPEPPEAPEAPSNPRDEIIVEE